MDHPRRVIDGVSFVIKFWTDRMYGFGDIAIFKFWHFGLMPVQAPFEWVFGAHFQMMPLITLTPKRTVLGLNHVIWAIKGREVRAGRWKRNRTVQDRTGQYRKKVTKGLYFTYWGKSPHWSDLHRKLCSRWRLRHNHACRVSKWNFQGVTILHGVEFSIFLLIFECAVCECDACTRPMTMIQTWHDVIFITATVSFATLYLLSVAVIL